MRFNLSLFEECRGLYRYRRSKASVRFSRAHPGSMAYGVQVPGVALRLYPRQMSGTLRARSGWCDGACNQRRRRGWTTGFFRTTPATRHAMNRSGKDVPKSSIWARGIKAEPATGTGLDSFARPRRLLDVALQHGDQFA